MALKLSGPCGSCAIYDECESSIIGGAPPCAILAEESRTPTNTARDEICTQCGNGGLRIVFAHRHYLYCPYCGCKLSPVA
jgi:hypothetical protein